MQTMKISSKGGNKFKLTKVNLNNDIQADLNTSGSIKSTKALQKMREFNDTNMSMAIAKPMQLKSQKYLGHSRMKSDVRG